MASTELRQEDSMSSKNPYAWSKSSEPDISLDHFLTKYRPSMVRDDGMKPWLWVRAREPSEERTVEGETAAIAQAAVVLEEATEKVQSIQNDASIPVRSNKKTGAKSKKEVREQVQAEAAEKLKEIAIKNGYTCGKWLVFASSEKVDSIWSSVARSLVDGPLSKTLAYCTKVATCPADEKPNYQHVLCIYMPNVYDKDVVTEVMKVLLRHHGLNLSGVKTDLYTDLSIDSKHPSGIPSTIWKATSLMKDTEIKELRGAFFDELAAKPKDSGPSPMPNEQEKSSETAQPDEEKPKPKPKAKLKKMQRDTFVSDDDEEDAEEEEKRKEELKKKMAKTRKRDDSDDEEKPKKKTAKM
ncbi:hypothetical protein ARMSODRAFT_951781 [Armillaria solidipes]|uniref:DUF1917-domain-containing protein n=1 Tax=Armillaria solidipes TaxID=1076256 RepID=A0A2H3BTM9_9AGAR|nr:hypothetical protein ARMSODRAFT_951781 [Armillaria solidipes]